MFRLLLGMTIPVDFSKLDCQISDDAFILKAKPFRLVEEVLGAAIGQDWVFQRVGCFGGIVRFKDTILRRRMENTIRRKSAFN